MAEEWDREHKGRHLYRIQKVNQARKTSRNRMKEDIITRKHVTGNCDYCDELEDLEHVLIQ